MPVNGLAYMSCTEVLVAGAEVLQPDLRDLPDCAKRIKSNPKSQVGDMMPSQTGYTDTRSMRREARAHDDALRSAFGICRGLMLGAALWSVVGFVALAIGSTGDAQVAARTPLPDAQDAARPLHTDAQDAARPPPRAKVTVTVDRGGHR